MQIICSTYLLVMSLVGAVNIEQQLNFAAIAYYDSILTKLVPNWEITVKRCTVPRSVDVSIVGVRGEEWGALPRGSRICWIDAMVDGKLRSLPVTVAIKTFELLPIATTDIKPRSLIDDSMVEWRELESTKLGAAKVPAESDFDNYWTKVRIPKGAVIEFKRLNPIPVIVSGQEISIVIRVGIVEVKTKGKALEDGRLGERIRILNELTGKRLKGVVDSEEIVVVK